MKEIILINDRNKKTYGGFFITGMWKPLLKLGFKQWIAGIFFVLLEERIKSVQIAFKLLKTNIIYIQIINNIGF